MKVGDKVTWTSQAGGSEKTKHGVIIAMIPVKHGAMQHIPKTAKSSHIKFDTNVSLSRDRALVAVPAGKNGQITHYYCPEKSVLLKQRDC